MSDRQNAPQMKDMVLALDLGSNSIGWALVGAEFDENGLQVRETGIIAVGVRVFAQSRDPKSNQPTNVQRRAARSARRRQRRRRERRQRLVALLQDGGLLPGDSEQLATVLAADPYALRARALDEALEPYQLGRVFFHLNQRRGFKSNRKDSSKRDEEGKVYGGIGELERAMSEAGARTLGEYLHHLGENGRKKLAKGERVRGRYTHRKMYEKEFDQIWRVQKAHHPQLLTDELRGKLRDEVIFFQRSYEVTQERLAQLPSRANARRAPSVGACSVEPEEYRCSRGDWVAQQFRIYKEVANLRVIDAWGYQRALKLEERQKILDALTSTREQKFENLRKKIGLSENERFNLERGQRKKLDGNTVEAALISAFEKKRWSTLPEQDKQRLRTAIVQVEDDDTLREILAPYALGDKAVDALLKFDVPDGYMRYSRKAMERMLPFLEEGKNEYEALQAAGYGGMGDTRVFDYLPPLVEVGIEIRNPVVERALVETRKVVNALLRAYGRPRRIVVELAREVTLSQKQREEYSKMMRQRESQRAEAREMLRAEFGIPQPSRDDIDRFLLWKEQGGRCPYTGEPIPQSELFSESVQVDHILPRWRSLDDSFGNKVLCKTQANQEKGDRTPREWLMETDGERYQAVLKRVRDMSIDEGKRRRFEVEQLEEDFAQKQLNDTRYIAREVVAYLEFLYPCELRAGEKVVATSRGQFTADLRRVLGLNDILSRVRDSTGNALKSREDHRHHAVDAVTIALATRKRLKKYSDFLRARHTAHEVSFDTPWDEFRETVARAVTSIVVSHRVNRRLSGALHKETFYGATGTEGVYVTRKALAQLTKGDVDDIRDKRIRELVQERLRQHGWDGQSNQLPKGAFQEPLYLPPRKPDGEPQVIKRVRIKTRIGNPIAFRRPDESEPFRYAAPSENHHVEIVEVERNGKKKLVAKVVSMMEAARRARRDKVPIVCREHGPGTRFVMSLAKGECLEMTDSATGQTTVVVVGVMSQKGTFVDLTLIHASDARPGTEANKSPFKRITSAKEWVKWKPRKVAVSPIGVVREAND